MHRDCKRSSKRIVNGLENLILRQVIKNILDNSTCIVLVDRSVVGFLHQENCIGFVKVKKWLQQSVK